MKKKCTSTFLMSPGPPRQSVKSSLFCLFDVLTAVFVSRKEHALQGPAAVRVASIHALKLRFITSPDAGFGRNQTLFRAGNGILGVILRRLSGQMLLTIPGEWGKLLSERECTDALSGNAASDSGPMPLKILFFFSVLLLP